MNYPGMRVIESVYLEQDGDPMQVRRTWCERLFTRPWRPLVTTKTIVVKVPYRGVVRLDDNTVVMHPATLNELRKTLG